PDLPYSATFRVAIRAGILLERLLAEEHVSKRTRFRRHDKIAKGAGFRLEALSLTLPEPEAHDVQDPLRSWVVPLGARQEPLAGLIEHHLPTQGVLGEGQLLQLQGAQELPERRQRGTA